MNYSLSQAEENYLKAIYTHQTDSGKGVSTNTIAKKLETKASSVTDMIKKLAEKGLVNYIKYQGVSLTDDGVQNAVWVIRKHRLWEVFLVRHLDFSWDEVHEVAEQLEHVKSAKLIDQLDAFLEFPTHDPHGDPIPDKDGNFVEDRNILLGALKVDEECVIVGVKDSSTQFLQYLDKAEIALGKKTKIVARESFDNSMQLAFGEEKRFVSQQIANNLYVKKIN